MAVIWVVVALLLVVVPFFLVLKRFIQRKNGLISVGSSHKNTTPVVLIVGPSGSGKTALFERLVNGKSSITAAFTVMSQEPNIAPDFKTSDGHKCMLIEFPGHNKLKYKMGDAFSRYSNIKGVVFMVDATLDPKSQKFTNETARYLYDVLNYTEACNADVLIACNKSESFTARPAVKISKTLEEAVSRIIERKKASLEENSYKIGGEDEDGTGGDKALDSLASFTFQALEGQVNVLEGSVLKGKIDKWSDWLEERVQ